MGFKLPRLTTDIDCGPIGYPGLKVRYWLNPTYEDYEPPADAEPWESVWFYGLGRSIEAVTIPASMTDDGKGRTITIGNGKALHGLWTTPGFDQQIINWSFNQLGKQRQERREAEAKNSDAASGELS